MSKSNAQKISVAILGASGYTGAELLRLLHNHPNVEIKFLSADRKAGLSIAQVFPQFAPFSYPNLQTIDELFPILSQIDFVFCALPHGTTQDVIAELLAAKPTLKIVDLSADYRLPPASYAKWYDHEHKQVELQKQAVYGLCEVYADKIKKAQLVANPGCYTTISILTVRPLLAQKLIDPNQIIIDAKSGVSGAGRSLKEGNLYCEVAQGMHAYGVGHHRHMGEIDMELSNAAGHEVVASFTPHLIPMNRGMQVTAYVQCVQGKTVANLHEALCKTYNHTHFVHVLPFGDMPQTRHVTGTNQMLIGVTNDRLSGRAIVVSVIDNLVKGASGQAVQNMNLMMSYPENEALNLVAVYP